MDHYAGNPIAQIEVLLAEQAGLLVDEVVHEGIYLILVEVGWVLGLLEEVGGRVLQRLHNLNIMDGSCFFSYVNRPSLTSLTRYAQYTVTSPEIIRLAQGVFKTEMKLEDYHILGRKECLLRI